MRSFISLVYHIKLIEFNEFNKTEYNQYGLNGRHKVSHQSITNFYTTHRGV